MVESAVPSRHQVRMSMHHRLARRSHGNSKLLPAGDQAVRAHRVAATAVAAPFASAVRCVVWTKAPAGGPERPERELPGARVGT